MHYYIAARAVAAPSGVTFGEIIVLISLLLLVIANVLAKKIDNTFLAILVPTVVTLLAGILIAAAYPLKLLVPLYHLTKGKLGVP